MALYWLFDLDAVASRIKYADAMIHSQTMEQVMIAFENYRASNLLRETRQIPL